MLAAGFAALAVGVGAEAGIDVLTSGASGRAVGALRLVVAGIGVLSPSLWVLASLVTGGKLLASATDRPWTVLGGPEGSPPFAPSRARTAGWCEPARSCSKRRWPCAWSCRRARPPRSPRSSGPATGCGCRRRTRARPAAPPGPAPRGAGRGAQGRSAVTRRPRPNERWITDVLVGPWVPHPDAGVDAGQALLDRRRSLPAAGRTAASCADENTRAGQETLRAAIVRRGLPEVSTPTTARRSQQHLADPDLRRARHPPGPLQALLA